jgi:hypothetical protein
MVVCSNWSFIFIISRSTISLMRPSQCCNCPACFRGRNAEEATQSTDAGIQYEGARVRGLGSAPTNVHLHHFNPFQPQLYCC